MSDQSSKKVKVNSITYKNQASMLSQELSWIMDKCLAQYDKTQHQGMTPQIKAKFKQGLKRRMFYYVGGCKQILKTTLIPNDQPQQQQQKKIVLPHDQNIVQNNQIKSRIIDHGIKKMQRIAIPKIPLKITTQVPQSVSIQNQQGKLETYNKAKTNLINKYQIKQQKIQSLNYSQNMVTQGYKRLSEYYQQINSSKNK